MSGVDGVSRFLQRVWRLAVDEGTGELQSRLTDAPGTSEEALWKTLHKTTKKVVEDTEGMRFNTAISQMMIFVNEATSSKTLPKETLGLFTRVLAPYAPHIAEEIWNRLGCEGLVSIADFPVHDEALCTEDTITLIIQVNGKKRDNLDVPKNASKQELENLALAAPNAVKFMDGKEPKRVIVVPGRLVNIVI